MLFNHPVLRNGASFCISGNTARQFLCFHVSSFYRRENLKIINRKQISGYVRKNALTSSKDNCPLKSISSVISPIHNLSSFNLASFLNHKIPIKKQPIILSQRFFIFPPVDCLPRQFFHDSMIISTF